MCRIVEGISFLATIVVVFAGCTDSPSPDAASRSSVASASESGHTEVPGRLDDPEPTIPPVAEQDVAESRREGEAHLKRLGVEFVSNDSIFASGIAIRDADLQAFQFFPEARRISLGKTEVSGPGLRFLTCEDLESLLLFDAPVTDEGFCNLPILTQLKRLDLSGTQIGGAALRHVANFTELDTLTLRDCPISDESLVHLKSLPKLKRIDLSGCRVGDDGALILAEFPAITVIELNRTQVTDAGVVALASIPNLFNLSLRDTALTDEGVTRLAESATDSLKVLALRGTKVSSNCVPDLLRLRELFSLDVRATVLTDEDLETLRDARPGLRLNERDLLED